MQMMIEGHKLFIQRQEVKADLPTSLIMSIEPAIKPVEEKTIFNEAADTIELIPSAISDPPKTISSYSNYNHPSDSFQTSRDEKLETDCSTEIGTSSSLYPSLETFSSSDEFSPVISHIREIKATDIQGEDRDSNTHLSASDFFLVDSVIGSNIASIESEKENITPALPEKEKKVVKVKRVVSATKTARKTKEDISSVSTLATRKTRATTSTVKNISTLKKSS